jgi:hypothetical protein
MAEKDSGLGVKFLEGASSGANVVGTYTRARAARGQALYDAAMADLEAADVRNVGNTRAARQEGRADRATGKVRTQVAGRGFTVGAGTARDLEDATDFISRLDALTIRENTRRADISKRAEAGSHRLRASSISPGGEAVGTLIGEAALVSRRWAQDKKDR